MRLQNFRVPMQRSETWWKSLTFWCRYHRLCLTFLWDLSAWAHVGLTFAGPPSVSFNKSTYKCNLLNWHYFHLCCLATDFGEDKMSEGIQAYVSVFLHLWVARVKEFPSLSFHTLVLKASISLPLSSLLLKTLVLPKKKVLGSDEKALLTCCLAACVSVYLAVLNHEKQMMQLCPSSQNENIVHLLSL